jgi:hypothetical protein
MIRLAVIAFLGIVPACCDDFEQIIAPLRAQRDKDPGNIAAHERYQDAVREHGIEGHLRALAEEYGILAVQHPEDFHFAYLRARSLIGRNTPSAEREIKEILAAHPEFIPAPINDPPALPDLSSLAANGDPDRVIEMAEASLRADEWRLQRIRAFDWYGVEFKQQAQQDLRLKYWKVWAIEVRAHRNAGRLQQAAELLAQMEQRAVSLKTAERAAIMPLLEELRDPAK